MKLAVRILAVVNLWVLLLIATSNLIAATFEAFEATNVVLTLILLAGVSTLDLLTMLYDVSRRLSRLDALARLLRR